MVTMPFSCIPLYLAFSNASYICKALRSVMDKGYIQMSLIFLSLAVFTLEDGQRFWTNKSSQTDKSSLCENGTDTILDVNVV